MDSRLGASRASLGAQLGHGIVRKMLKCKDRLNVASKGNDAAVVLANRNAFENVSVPRLGTEG